MWNIHLTPIPQPHPHRNPSLQPSIRLIIPGSAQLSALIHQIHNLAQPFLHCRPLLQPITLNLVHIGSRRRSISGCPE